ncbi:hypothetical protein DPMN_187499 [Dreissena polymorpha]|uniref:Uncharacterized protein n=1 Tax=Dreissena polymorpha TaxID=45954 RepID=A0A9D4IAE8_DREPO|nr:hypothetical protein DPMN_187499 [Dreissena polymorpha]
MSTHTYMQVKLTSAERQFRYACRQVMIISSHLEEATLQYHVADRTGNKIFSYNIRLRLSILDGVRNMFYEFAAKKAAEIIELQQSVFDVIEPRDVTLGESDSDLSADDMSVTSASGSESDYSIEMCE